MKLKAPQLAPLCPLPEPQQQPEQPRDQSNAFLASMLAMRGGAGRLPYREPLESAFGEDFGDVRVTLGVPLLEEMGVAAVASRDRIAFASARPSREVVAHELAHVVQHRRGRASARLGPQAGAAEREAEQAAEDVSSGEPVQIEGQADGAVQCMLMDASAFRAAVYSRFYNFDTRKPRTNNTQEENTLFELDRGSIEQILILLQRLNNSRTRLQLSFEEAFDRGLPAGEGGPVQEVSERVRKLQMLDRALNELMARANTYCSLTDAAGFKTAVDTLSAQVAAEIKEIQEEGRKYEAWAAWVRARGGPDTTWDPEYADARDRVWQLGTSSSPPSGESWAYDNVYAHTPPQDRPRFAPPADYQQVLRSGLGAEGMDTSLVAYPRDPQQRNWLYADPAGSRRPTTPMVCRIYLNPHPSFFQEISAALAPSLWFRGQEGASLTPPGKDTGSTSSGPAHRLKICDPLDMGKRPDQLVIYVFGSTAADAYEERTRLAKALAELQARPLEGALLARAQTARLPLEHRTWRELFLRQTPALTVPFPGLRGASHAPHPEGKSFGESRIQPLQDAFHAAGGSQERFRHLATRKAWEADIDPAHPRALRFPPAGPASASDPDPDPAPPVGSVSVISRPSGSTSGSTSGSSSGSTSGPPPVPPRSSKPRRDK
jgi:hypothetical protein